MGATEFAAHAQRLGLQGHILKVFVAGPNALGCLSASHGLQ